MAAVASGSSALAPVVPVPSATPGWTAFPRIAMRTPGIEPESVSAARRFTVQTMARWGVAERGDDVAIVVSELLSNALRHGLPSLRDPRPDRPIRLGLVHSGPSLMCAVADPSDQLPVPREAGWLDESGRGLHVIASLSDQWGSCMARGRPGKVVWATFATA
jgi:anti-sigma regulatory factor (Ser/Thr protein kinase)